MTPAAEYTSDEAGLLAAILESPEGDGPRLIYADWLEENGKPERASFIRVQCELARLPGIVEFNRLVSQLEWDSLRLELRGWMRFELSSPRDRIGVLYYQGPNPKVEPLRRRERDLFANSGPAGWWDVPGQWRATVGTSPPQIESADGYRYVVRRGFVECVSLPTAAFLKHAAELARRHPVERVVLTDREPYHNAADCWMWAASRLFASGRAENSVLPRDLFALLADDIDILNRSSWRTYRTRDAANLALSRAACRYARAAAGLTDPPSAVAPAASAPPSSAPPPGTRRPR